MRPQAGALAAVLLCLALAAAAQPYRSGKPGKEVRLFNGRDLTGWTFHLSDPAARMQDVWRVDPREPVLICRGYPIGYIRTTKDYTSFILRLQWRFSPITKQAGNGGVLLRVTGPDKVWPRSIEAQLQSGGAGDIWLIDEAPLNTPPERVDPNVPRHRLHIRANERPIGEWNDYEIVCDGPEVTLKVNGVALNAGDGAEVVPGKIALQSEGAEIHFRSIRLIPLVPRK